MTIQSILRSSPLCALDSELLLAHALDHDRSWLLAHSNYNLSDLEQKRWREFCHRREACEPIAYILGEKEFYGRSFMVDQRVLIPRPSTEGLIDTVKEVLGKENNYQLSHLPAGKMRTREVDTDIVIYSEIWGDLSDVSTIVDVGTGSGCIAVSLCLEMPDIHALATDVSADALAVARENAARHNCSERIDFVEGALLKPFSEYTAQFLLVSNPPYIPVEETLMPDVVNYEPALALFGGDDGADIVRKLMEQARSHRFCQGVVIECRKDQVFPICHPERNGSIASHHPA